MRIYFYLFLFIIFAHSVDGQVAVRSLILENAKKEIGVRETAPNSGKRVKDYLAICNLPEGYDYCAAFCSFILIKSGGSFKNPWAPAWFPRDKIIYFNGKVIKSFPSPGDFVGFYSIAQKRICHIGIIEKWGAKIVITVEANTGHPQGVHRMYRAKKVIYAVSRW